MQTAARIRRQLSLFVPAHAAVAIEEVRRVLDPVQHALIPAHVTLSRDDEVLGLADLGALSPGDLAPLTLSFGRPKTFDGHGVLLPCTSGEDQFASLRERILHPRAVRKLTPHITLAHPRNPRSAIYDLSVAEALPAEIEITFPEVRLIEQANGGPWRVLDTRDL